jgi:hypothetical protein
MLWSYQSTTKKELVMKKQLLLVIVCFIISAFGIFTARFGPFPHNRLFCITGSVIFLILGMWKIFYAGIEFGRGRLRWPKEKAIYLVLESTMMKVDGRNEVVLNLQPLKLHTNRIVVRDETAPRYGLVADGPPFLYSDGDCAFGGYKVIQRIDGGWRRFPEFGGAVITEDKKGTLYGPDAVLHPK